MKYIMMPHDSRIGNKRAADSMLEAAGEIVQKHSALTCRSFTNISGVCIRVPGRPCQTKR